MLVSVLLSFSTLESDAQTSTTYTDEVEMECPNIQGCEKIIIQVNTTITDNTSLECGEFDVSVSFNVLQGADCISDPDEDIYKVRWFDASDYKDYNGGKDCSVHFSNSGSHQISLEFAVKTVCGSFSFDHENGNSIHYVVLSPNDCSGCQSAISYCDLFCGGSEDEGVIPEIYEVRFFADEYHEIKINTTNNYGIFNFPYYMRDEHDCPNLKPALDELIFDINRFLDLASSGSPEYSDYYGHACLRHGYGEPYVNGNGVDLCKIRIKVYDSGVFFKAFHIVKNYPFDLQACKVEEYNELCAKDVHFSSKFLIDNSCIEYGGYSYNANYDFSPKHYKPSLNNYIVYPTISTYKISISGMDNSNNKEWISVYNVNGQTVMETICKKDNDIMEIDISKYKKGIYIIKLQDETKGTIKIKKFIKI